MNLSKLCLLVPAFCPMVAFAVQIRIVPPVPVFFGATRFEEIVDLSSDGSTALLQPPFEYADYGYNITSTWNQAEGFYTCPLWRFGPTANIQGRYITGDGRQVLGTSPVYDTTQQSSAAVFRWTPTTGETSYFPGGYGNTTLINATSNGTALVQLYDQTVIWNPDGSLTNVQMQMNGYYGSISEDAHTVVRVPWDGVQPLRWSAGHGVTALPGVDGGTYYVPKATSADGLVSVGFVSVAADGIYLLRWTTTPDQATTTAETLAGPFGSDTIYTDISLSGDGSQMAFTSESGACIYSTGVGLMTLTDYLASLGVYAPFPLSTVSAMTSDTQNFGGSTYTYDEDGVLSSSASWIISVPEPAALSWIMILPAPLGRRRR